MSKYGYLEVFQRVPSTSRQRESTVFSFIVWGESTLFQTKQLCHFYFSLPSQCGSTLKNFSSRNYFFPLWVNLWFWMGPQQSFMAYLLIFPLLQSTFMTIHSISGTLYTLLWKTSISINPLCKGLWSSVLISVPLQSKKKCLCDNPSVQLCQHALVRDQMFSCCVYVSFSLTIRDRCFIFGAHLHVGKSNRNQWTVDLYFMVHCT